VTAKPSRAAQTKAQLAERLGLAEWQIERAEREGIIPAKDRSKGWSADLADELVSLGARRIRTLVGAVPDMAAWDTARYLESWLGVETVQSDTVRELARASFFTVVSYDREYPVFDGRAIEAFSLRDDAKDIVERAAITGASLMADSAANVLGIRRADFDHLVRAGLIQPVRIGRTGHWSKSRDPGLPLYRSGDVLDLLDLDHIDWAAVRATPKGKRSPLAKLPTAH
jgi:hypothetical protein